MAPTGLQADNHIIRHWGCQKVGHVGQDMGAAPGRGTGPPDRPIRASPGMGSLAGSWYRGLSVTVPTRVTQGKSLHVPLHLQNTCSTHRTDQDNVRSRKHHKQHLVGS